MSIDKAKAAKELLNRRAARNSLLEFVQYTTPRWKPGKIHYRICEQLERINRREIDRLMLLCPPQHGKSTIISKRFPAYFLATDPTKDVIQVSASVQLAEEFGAEVRNCVRSEEFLRLYPDVRLSEDSQARGRWSTNKGGSYFAVGIGGQLYGRGGAAIIDDPFGTWADAQSQLERDKVWNWYTGTLVNRIRPGEPIAVIQHRVAEDDLVGRLLAQQVTGGDKWTVVELPADVDDPPWPERYDREALIRMRDNMDKRQWQALYMQNPTPDDGTFFTREMFELFDPRKVPRCHTYMSGDFAVTEGDGDFTDIGTHGYSDGTLYLGLDGWTGQTTADVWIDQLLDQARDHKPFAFFGESGPIRRAVEPFLTRRMQERKIYVRCEWLTRGHDKPTEARPLQAMAGLRKVKIADTEYGYKLLTQLLKFPAGSRDDAVDMAALMAKAIDVAHPAIVLPPKTQESPRGAKTIQEMVDRFEQQQARTRRI
jgi:hypothetical protein